MKANPYVEHLFSLLDKNATSKESFSPEMAELQNHLKLGHAT